MNCQKLFIFLIFLISSSLIFPQNDFEGKVVFEFNEDGDSHQMTYLAKDGKFRIDSPDNEGTTIFDLKAGKMLMVMDGEKIYMEMPVDWSKEVQSSTEKTAETFVNTGETKEILGYTCEKFLFKSDDFNGEAWMTKDLGGLMLFGNLQEPQSSGQAWQHDIMQAGFLPILMNETDSNGKVVSSFKVLEVEPKTLDSKLFEVPSGYQKFEMPNMNTDSYK